VSKWKIIAQDKYSEYEQQMCPKESVDDKDLAKTATAMKIVVLWDVSTCSLRENFQRFGQPVNHMNG
jgi:hypothetical protein